MSHLLCTWLLELLLDLLLGLELLLLWLKLLLWRLLECLLRRLRLKLLLWRVRLECLLGRLRPSLRPRLTAMATEPTDTDMPVPTPTVATAVDTSGDKSSDHATTCLDQGRPTNAQYFYLFTCLTIFQCSASFDDI